MGFGLPVIFPSLFFSSVLRLTLFARSGVFVILLFFLFFPARSFSSVGHLTCGGRARQIVSFSFCVHFFFFLFRFVFFVSVFSLIVSFRLSIS